MLWSFNSVKANSNDIDIIYPGKPNPLYNEINFSPGQNVTKTITIRNTSAVPKNLSIQVQNISNQNLAKVLVLKISSGSSIYFSQSLFDLQEPKETFVTFVSPGDTNLDINVEFSNGASNEYQNQNISFDILFGFIGFASPAEPIVLAEHEIPTTAGDLVSISAQDLTTRLFRGLAGLTGFAQAEPVVETKSAEESQKVLGEEIAKDNWTICLPWWAWLLILLLILLLLWLLLKKRGKT